MSDAPGTRSRPRERESVSPTMSRDESARRFAVEKDPLGDRVHAWFATAALALQSLTPVTALVGLIVLAGYAGLRLHATAKCYRTLIAGPLLPILVAILAWTAMSIIWSPDPEAGLDNLGKYRVGLLVFGLWPVVHHARMLILGLGFGAAVNAVVQILMILHVVPDPHFQPVDPSDVMTHTGGLTRHPGMTALFASMSSVLLLGLVLQRIADLRIAIALWFGCIVNVALAGNRTIYLALPVALAAVVVTNMWIGGVRRRSIGLAGLCAAVFIVGGVALTPAIDRLQMLYTELESALTSDEFSSSGGARFAWWKTSVPIGLEDPLIGHGGGSTRVVFEERMDEIGGRDESTSETGATGMISTGDPHSTLLLAWVEQGGIGVGLWCALFATAVFQSLARAVRDPAWRGLPAAWLILLAYALTNSITMSTFTMSALAVLVTFTVPISRFDPRRSSNDSKASLAS